MDRESLFAAYREHVNAGKIDTFERYGFDAVMGKRDAWAKFEASALHAGGAPRRRLGCNA